MAKLLVSYGAEVNIQNDVYPIQAIRSISKFRKNLQLGWTALHFAARAKAILIVELLLNNGADVNIMDKVNCLDTYHF